MSWFKKAQTAKIKGIKPSLQGLAQEALKYPTFQEFAHAFSIDIKHGTYWHVTDNPNFNIDPNNGPTDASSMGGGQKTKGALMFTSHLDNWTNYYGNARPYAALLDLSNVTANQYRQVNRGFGNEFFLADARNVKVIGVYPIQQAKQLNRRRHNTLPTSDKELLDLYNQAHQNSKQEIMPTYSNDPLRRTT